MNIKLSLILVLQVFCQNILSSPVLSSVDYPKTTGLNQKRHSARSVLMVNRKSNRESKKSSRRGIKQLRRKFEKKLEELENRYQQRMQSVTKNNLEKKLAIHIYKKPYHSKITAFHSHASKYHLLLHLLFFYVTCIYHILNGMHILTIGMLFNREKVYKCSVVITATHSFCQSRFLISHIERLLTIFDILFSNSFFLLHSALFISKLENDMQHQQYSYDLKLSTLESRLTLLASRDGFVLYDDVRYDGQDLETIHTSREEAKKRGGMP